MTTSSNPEDDPSIAVTGAAGYIGSRVVARLCEEYAGSEITAIDNFYHGEIERIGDVTVRDVDVSDRDELEAALAGADVVMHLAAVSGVDDCRENPELAYEYNVAGTNNVAWFCHQHGAGLVFPISMGILGDPTEFPITVDQPRDPMNWYGRTKVLGERAIETFADGRFPAICLMKSNLYGDHEVDGTRVSKGTVINFFVDRALEGESLTVYEPGTQARNYVHVKDIADSYLGSLRRLQDRLAEDDTGAESYEIASDEDPSVMAVAKQVQAIAAEVAGIDVDVELIENPRAGEETLTDSFAVDTARAERDLDWNPTRDVETTVRELIERRSG